MSNTMTPREHAAFAAGIETARQMAMVAAVTLEVRPDGASLKHQAAAAALQALAEGLRSAFLDPLAEPSPMRRAFAAIAADPGTSGEIPCPTCAGRLQWARDSFNGHLHARCETPGCLVVMQ